MSNYYLNTQEAIEDGKDLHEQLSIALNIIALNAISNDDTNIALHLKKRLLNIDETTKIDETTRNSIIRTLYVSLHLTTTKSAMNMQRFCEDIEKLVDLLNWNLI